MTTWDVREGDVLDRLREMPDESVHCVVTSPPYWGLRDYGTASWDGGDPSCGHQEQRGGRNPETAGKQLTNQGTIQTGYRDVCGRCGARRVDQQLGLEATPDCGLWSLSPALRELTGLASCGVCYVCRMVAVFREVRRVLRSDGTCFVNMGDGYAAGGGGGRGDSGNEIDGRATSRKHDGERIPKHAPAGLKPKDLIGMPWRLAFALQADGWWLRSEIIWAKPNPMPESVTDRPTKAHEQIFLLTKRGTYFFDADAIREKIATVNWRAATGSNHNDAAVTLRNDGERHGGGQLGDPAGRNARSVWTIATQPYAEAHFATFPEELPRRCILAGCPVEVCSTCYNPIVNGSKSEPSMAQQSPTQTGVRPLRRVLRGHESELLQSDMSQPERESQANEAPAVVPVLWAAGEPDDREDVFSEVCGGASDGYRLAPAPTTTGRQGSLVERRPGDRQDPRLRDDPRPDDAALRTGASASDGRDAGAPPSLNRVCAPPERNQDGQPARESGTDGVQPAPGPDSMPVLRAGVRDPLSPCCSAPIVGGTVLDPFSGAATTGLVAVRLGRSYIGIELNPEYARMGERRILADHGAVEPANGHTPAEVRGVQGRLAL